MLVPKFTKGNCLGNKLFALLASSEFQTHLSWGPCEFRTWVPKYTFPLWSCSAPACPVHGSQPSPAGCLFKAGPAPKPFHPFSCCGPVERGYQKVAPCQDRLGQEEAGPFLGPAACESCQNHPHLPGYLGPCCLCLRKQLSHHPRTY